MRFIPFLFLLFIFSCQEKIKTKELTLEEIFSSKFEHSLISSGDNFPDFSSKNDSIDLFLISLHHDIEIKTFQNKAGWSDSLLKNKIDFLKSKNWLNNDFAIKPSVFIASDIEGNKLLELAKPISIKIAESIENEILNVKTEFLTTDLSKTQNFETMSFLLLSNVLLDNWQIRRVEQDFLLKDQRPERHKKHYYYSIIQNRVYPKEKFGIYGNQFGKINDSIPYSVYGNNRIKFLKKIRTDSTFKNSVLLTAPVINANDNEFFEKIANSYAPKLLTILNNNREYMKRVYRNMGYENEITFEEFFIWWYHFIYTDATNILALKGKIEIPYDGNFPYLIKK